MMNPALALRMMLRDETGDPSRYFPTPSPSAKKYNGQPSNGQSARGKRGEGKIQANMGPSAGEKATPKIDVTEDDFEGESSTNDAGQAHADTGAEAGNGPRLHVEVDNISPLIDRSKALAQELEDGADPYDKLEEIARVLADIQKIDEGRKDIERKRHIDSDKKAAKKFDRETAYAQKVLDNAIKRATEREYLGILNQFTTVGDHYPHAPDKYRGLPLPRGYEFDGEGRVWKVTLLSSGVVNRDLVTAQPTFICGWSEHLTTGKITVSILTETRTSGWKVIDSKPSQIKDTRAVLDLANDGLSIPEQSLFTEYLQASYDTIRVEFGEAPELETDRCGWHLLGSKENPTAAYVFPDLTVGSDVPILLEPSIRLHDMVQGYSAKGHVEEEKKTITKVLKDWPKTSLAIGTAVAAVLMRPANTYGTTEFQGFFTEIVGRTGAGKTSTDQIALSVVANPHEVRAFNGTGFANGTALPRMFSDMPIGFQETQEMDFAKEIGKLIHALGDNGGKLQGTVDGHLRTTPRLYNTVMIANNESVLPPDSKDGPRQRVLTQGPPIPKTEENRVLVEKTIRDLSQNHGHGLRLVVQHLVKEANGSWKQLQENIFRGHQNEILQVSIPGVIKDEQLRDKFQRKLKYIALARLGLRYLLECYGCTSQQVESMLKGIQEAVNDLSRDIAEDEAEAQESTQYLSRVSELILMNGARIRGREHQIQKTEDVTNKPNWEDEESDVIIPVLGYIGAETTIDGVEHIGIRRGFIEDYLKTKFGKPLAPLLKIWVADGVITQEVTTLQDGSVKRQMARKVNRRDPDGRDLGRMICFKKEALEIDD